MIIKSKTAMSWLTLEMMRDAKLRGVEVSLFDLESSPQDTLNRIESEIKYAICPSNPRIVRSTRRFAEDGLKIISSCARNEIAARIRYARSVLKSEDCTGIKCKVAGEIRQDVRAWRNRGWISFECCEALQRALDY